MDTNTFKENAKKTIDKIFMQIDELEAKKDLAKAKAKVEYTELINNLKSKKFELQEKYKNLEKSSEEKWDSASKDFSKSAEFFKEGISKVASMLS
ncbi:MAG TPA: hypothetical protein PKM97_00645 [Bacteroidia bacterium]|nr:hypothetical protein [Bacteroidia bacterium]